MPRGTSGQEFLLEYNVGIFVRKLVDSIYRGPRKKEKTLGKFCLKMPLGPTSQEF